MTTRTELRKGRRNFNELLKKAGRTDTKGNTFISLGAVTHNGDVKSLLVSINDGDVDLVDYTENEMIYGTLHSVSYPVTGINDLVLIGSPQSQDALIKMIGRYYPEIYK
jgi:hypothetical protein